MQNIDQMNTKHKIKNQITKKIIKKDVNYHLMIYIYKKLKIKKK